MGLLAQPRLPRWLQKIHQAILSEIPIARPDMTTSAGKAQHDAIVTLVREAISTTKRLTSEDASTTSRLNRRLQAALRNLDAKVAELFELSHEELAAAKSIADR